MKWVNFLHIYQPAGQQPDILAAVVAQSYRPILETVDSLPNVKITLNITGALLELFDHNDHRYLIDILRRAGRAGKIDFTSSAKYHAFLPFLQHDEVIRQIKMNDETNKFYLGEAWKPKGFFPPEMAYDERLAPIVESLGFEWMMLDEIAYSGQPGQVDYTKNYKIKGTNLKVLFRERRLSNLIMSAVVRSPETLKEAMRDDLASNRYIVTAMDGETFGHHRPGMEKLLADILGSQEFDFAHADEIFKNFTQIEEISPVRSTWASSKEDIDRGIQFLSWSDPENMIHKWQWQLLTIAFGEVYAMDSKHSRYDEVRKKMDMAASSDHFWWASAKPWWSLEMIELGAFRLLDVIRFIPEIPREKVERAGELYQKIVSTAFQWQRTGRIRQMMSEQKSILRIPFKDRTIGKGGEEEGVYHAFMDMMKNLEEEASRKGEYEKAILWRDSRFKLENRLDIYDTINAIDLLRIEIPHKEVEETIEKYKEQYRKIRGGQPEQRGS